MAAKDRARGKALELHVGRLFGGRRRRNGEGVGFDDCVDEHGFELPVSIECKTYAKLQLRQEWIEQAKRNAGDRPWAIVQRPKGSRTIYATVDLEYLLELFWTIQNLRLDGISLVNNAIAATTNRTEENDVEGSNA